MGASQSPAVRSSARSCRVFLPNRLTPPIISLISCNKTPTLISRLGNMAAAVVVQAGFASGYDARNYYSLGDIRMGSLGSLTANGRHPRQHSPCLQARPAAQTACPVPSAPQPSQVTAELQSCRTAADVAAVENSRALLQRWTALGIYCSAALC